MALYVRKVRRTDSVFTGRFVISPGGAEFTPDNLVLCHGCNSELETGYLLYLDKRHLNEDRPYDVYCEDCLQRDYPKARIVG